MVKRAGSAGKQKTDQKSGNNLIYAATNKVEVIFRRVASKFGVDRFFVSKVFCWAGATYRVRQKALGTTPEQDLR